MKNIQTALLCIGLSLTSTHVLAVGAGEPCPEASAFAWTSQQFANEKEPLWTGVAGGYVLRAYSKWKPTVVAKKALTSQVDTGTSIPFCPFDIQTQDGATFYGRKAQAVR